MCLCKKFSTAWMKSAPSTTDSLQTPELSPDAHRTSVAKLTIYSITTPPPITTTHSINKEEKSIIGIRRAVARCFQVLHREFHQNNIPSKNPILHLNNEFSTVSVNGFNKWYTEGSAKYVIQGCFKDALL